MKSHLIVAGMAGFLASVLPATANTIFDLNHPPGDLGNSYTYSMNGINLTAYSGTLPGYPVPHLDGIVFGSHGNGLGVTGTADGEPTPTDFVQVDFSNAQSQGYTAAQFMMESVQPGEGWAVYGSNTQGSLGTLLATGNTGNSISLPSFSSYRYFSWTGTTVDVSLGRVQFDSNGNTQAPEPGTFLLIGLPVVAAFWRKLRAAHHA